MGLQEGQRRVKIVLSPHSAEGVDASNPHAKLVGHLWVAPICRWGNGIKQGDRGPTGKSHLLRSKARGFHTTSSRNLVSLDRSECRTKPLSFNRATLLPAFPRVPSPTPRMTATVQKYLCHFCPNSPSWAPHCLGT